MFSLAKGEYSIKKSLSDEISKDSISITSCTISNANILLFNNDIERTEDNYAFGGIIGSVFGNDNSNLSILLDKINTSAKIGRQCIINTASIVEHDNQIGDYVHLSPNVTCCGTVTIGELTHIGAGATIKNNINITDECIIGAGAVVVKDIQEKGTYVGVPAQKMK